MEQVNMVHEAQEQEGRFVAMYDGAEAGFIKYKYIDSHTINANGTLVHEAYRDKKLGAPLYEALMSFARENNFKIYPTCPFVVKMMLRDKSVQDMLTDKFKTEQGLS